MIFGVLASATAFGQDKPERPINIVTVCDVLLNPATMNGQEVAVIGRLDATDEGLWLSEDDCGSKVIVNGIVLPSVIWLNQSNAAQPGALKLDAKLLKPKLDQVQKTTKLGTHWANTCSIALGKPPTNCSKVMVKDYWSAVYGKIETMNYRDSGFGHLNGAPAQVTFKANQLVTVYADEPK
jgi:hypothetical protein